MRLNQDELRFFKKIAMRFQVYIILLTQFCTRVQN